MTTFDVGIIGLGAMGSAAAWQLARRGLRVLGFDRYTPPHHFGSTHGRSRVIREAYFEGPAYVPLVRRAYELWDELSRSAGIALLLPTGGLTIGPPDGALVTGARESARAHRVDIHELTAAETHERFPSLAVPGTHVAVWEPRAGAVLAEPSVQAMLTAARAAGAELLLDTEVTGWQPEPAGLRIATAPHDYQVSRLIVSAGPWTSALLPGTTLPITVERSAQFWFSPADPEPFSPSRLPVFLIEESPASILYGIPDHGYGVKLARHHGGETTTADTVRRLVDDAERDDIRRAAAQWLPDLASAPLEATVCLYTNTPDQHFVIDREPSDPRVVIVSACSGHGFKFAPAIGEAVADLVMDRTPRCDLSMFGLSRFAR